MVASLVLFAAGLTAYSRNCWKKEYISMVIRLELLEMQ